MIIYEVSWTCGNRRWKRRFECPFRAMSDFMALFELGNKPDLKLTAREIRRLADLDDLNPSGLDK